MEGSWLSLPTEIGSVAVEESNWTADSGIEFDCERDSGVTGVDVPNLSGESGAAFDWKTENDDTGESVFCVPICTEYTGGTPGDNLRFMGDLGDPTGDGHCICREES